MAILDLKVAKEYLGGVVGIDSLVVAGIAVIQPTFQTPTINPGVGVFAPIAGVFSEVPGSPNFSSDAAGIITYDGTSPRRTTFEAGLTVEALTAPVGDTVAIRMALNGVGLPDSEVTATSLGAWLVNMRCIWQVDALQPGDTMQLEVANLTIGTRNIGTGHIVWTAN